MRFKILLCSMILAPSLAMAQSGPPLTTNYPKAVMGHWVGKGSAADNTGFTGTYSVEYIYTDTGFKLIFEGQLLDEYQVESVTNGFVTQKSVQDDYRVDAYCIGPKRCTFISRQGGRVVFVQTLLVDPLFSNRATVIGGAVDANNVMDYSFTENLKKK